VGEHARGARGVAARRLRLPAALVALRSTPSITPT
jgi:hypothetical protein